jgi:hypothetical protein
MAMLDHLLIVGGYLFSGIALRRVLDPAWAFTNRRLRVTASLNLAGVGVAARVGLVVLVAEVVVLAVFVAAALAVLAAEGPARPWTSPFTGVGPFDRSLVMGAVSIAVLSYLGFDAIASFAEESAGDVRQVGRAILFCLVVVGLLVARPTGSGPQPGDPADPAARPEDQAPPYRLTRQAIAPARDGAVDHEWAGLRR